MPDYWEKSYSNLLQEITNPSIQISGTYRLAHRDEKFGDFLESLGMSRAHLTYLDKMDENLTIFAILCFWAITLSVIPLLILADQLMLSTFTTF